MKITKFAIFSITLAFASCSKKPTLIQGQIFVVTKGGENIKMGAVPVHVIPEESFLEIARSTVAAIERQQALEDEYRASVKVKEQLLKDLDAMKPVGFEAPALVALREDAENEEALQGLQSPDREQWLSDFARVLPTTQIQTDADGRFTAEVNSKVWLVAGGQRRVGDNHEEYLWVRAYEPPAKGMPQPVLISNRDNVRFKEELYALIDPLLGKGADLPAQEAPKPSEAVTQWSAGVKEQATQKVAEAKAMHERMVAEAKAKMQEELRKLSGKLESGVVGSNLELPLSTEVKQVFCFVSPGSFTIGGREIGSNGMQNKAEVKLTTQFWLAKTEVTQAQWEVVMGSNPSMLKGANLPVENVSWEDAQAFIATLNEKQILSPGWKFALPTEAQWEYACRAGESGSYSGGGKDEVAWWGEYTRPHEVAQKNANAWGFHDMHGNVWEWCANWSEFPLKGGIDPVGPSSGMERVARGGGVGLYKLIIGDLTATTLKDCDCNSRAHYNPKFRDTNLGVRSAIVKSIQ